MNNKQNLLGILFSAILVVLLILPSLQYFFHLIPEGRLYGYVEKKSSKPEKIITGWFDKKLQQYWENLFDNQIGFKPIFVRAFNEITFRLFSEEPRINLYASKKYGLYSKMSIDHLNAEYLNHDNLSKSYAEFSSKTAELQRLLEAKGKHFEVIISSSKPYIHPDGLGKRYLANTENDFFSNIASLGRELKKNGVNVIDSGPVLRALYNNKSIETHPYSGVHWNYYAGCIIAQSLFRDTQKTFSNIPRLDCGNPLYQKPQMIDVDGLSLLNVLSDVNLAKPSPYPTPRATFFVNFMPTILIVGDSFMDQIIYSLDESKSYSNLVLSGYFQTRLTHQPAQSLSVDNAPSLSTEQIQNAIIEDALKSDLIVLQMVDYNIPRYGYGFIDALLNRLKVTGEG